MRYRIIFHCDFTLESRMRSYSRHLIDNLRAYYRKSKALVMNLWILNQLSYKLPIPITRNVKFGCNVSLKSKIRSCSRRLIQNLSPYSGESKVSATTYQNFRENARLISEIRHNEECHVSSWLEKTSTPIDITRKNAKFGHVAFNQIFYHDDVIKINKYDTGRKMD